MKGIQELNAIRDQMQDKLHLTKNAKNARVVVGLATCGIAAGARPVLAACQEAVEKLGLNTVDVTQVGCIGVCRLEPMVEVYMPGQAKVTYVKVTAEKAARIIEEHVAHGHVVEEYTIGQADA